MKTKTSIVVLSILTLFVVGCGQAANTDQTTEIAPQEVNATPQTTDTQTVSAAQTLADQNAIEAAKQAGDLKMCDEINNKQTKQDCIDVVAYKLGSAGDEDACNRIKNSDLKKQCEEKLEEFTAVEKDQELFNEAFTENDASLCAKITDITEKSDCYHNVAINTNNAALCEKISESRTKEECKNAF